MTKTARSRPDLAFETQGLAPVCGVDEAGRGVPDLCPACSADALQGAGEGTEQLEQVLAKLQYFMQLNIRNKKNSSVEGKHFNW